MTKRDREKLQRLLVELTEKFSDPKRMTVWIGRGDARAIVAAIRALAAKEGT